MRLLCVAFVLALLAAGCSAGRDETPSGPPWVDENGPQSDREQVATVIWKWQAALGQGDAEEACSYLTDRGRRLWATFAEDLVDHELETCEEAVEATTISGIELVPFSFAVLIGAQDVSDQPPDVVTPAEVTIDRKAGTASGASDYRGYMDLKLQDGEWRIDVPGFFD